MKNKLENTFFSCRKKVLNILVRTFIFACVTATYGYNPSTSNSAAEKNILQQQITGTVTDENGLPLPGVTVIEKGTTTGTQSDFDGNYAINVSDSNTTLIFSYIGYKTTSIPANGKNTINLQMEEDVAQLDEVVVVGFGTQKSSQLVSSIAQVTSEELKADQRPVTSGFSALQGAVPGLVISNGNGSPGSIPNIRVRGISSLNDTGLLIIIDGFEGSLADIDPQTIESYSILKDASAVAVYGARGANGVLLVTTTNPGRDKKTTVSYNFSNSIQSKQNIPTTLNSQDYIQFQNTIVETENALSGSTDPLPWDNDVINLANSGFYPDTVWADEVYANTAIQQSHNLTVSGGSKNTGYLLSASYLSQEGLALGDDLFERLNLRLKIDTDINKWLSVGVNALLSNRTDKSVTTISSSSIRGLPFFPAITADGLFAANGTSDDFGNNVAVASSGSFSKTVLDRNNIQAYLKIKPIKGLVVEERFSVIKTNSLTTNWTNTYSTVSLDETDPDSYTNPDSANRVINPGTAAGRSLLLTDFTDQQFRNLISVTYENTFGKHNLKAFAAQQMEWGEEQEFETGRSNFLFDNVIALDQGSEIYNPQIDGALNNAATIGGNATTVSFIGRLNYSFADKYLLEASFRADASSFFLSENQWGYFPSVAAGWVVSKEGFLDNVNFIDLLKLRASYGTAGSDAGLGAVTQQLVVFDASGYPIGGVNNPRIGINSFVNPNLVWETSTISNIGIDASLFKGKLQLEAEYFENKRTNILDEITDTALEVGFGDADGNPYDVDSWGWELNLTHQNKIKDFGYRISGNISSYDNEITHIPGESTNPNFQEGQSINDRFGYQTDGFFDSQNEIDAYVAEDGVTLINQTSVGDSYIGGFKYVDQLTIDTDDDGIADAKDGVINSDDRVILQDNSQADLNFGFNLSMSYKNLSLSTRFYGTFDNKQWLNANEAVQPFLGEAVPFSYQTNVWSQTNQNAMFPRPQSATNPVLAYNTSVDHFLIDAEYIKLQNITLNYDFGNEILDKLKFVESMNLYFSAENIGVVWTNSSLFEHGWDPELGVASVNYPLPFTTSLGLNIKF